MLCSPSHWSVALISSGILLLHCYSVNSTEAYLLLPLATVSYWTAHVTLQCHFPSLLLVEQIMSPHNVQTTWVKQNDMDYKNQLSSLCNYLMSSRSSDSCLILCLRSVFLWGVQTDVSDSFSWTEFLRSAGKLLQVWIPAFIRIFYLVISQVFLLPVMSFQHTDVIVVLIVSSSILSSGCHTPKHPWSQLNLYLKDVWICVTSVETVVSWWLIITVYITPWNLLMVFAFILFGSVSVYTIFPIHTPVYHFITVSLASVLCVYV